MSAKRLDFDVFGRRVEVWAEDGRWCAYYPGPEGKRRKARDIVLPPGLDEAGIERYLDDLCHEWATPAHPRVTRRD